MSSVTPNKRPAPIDIKQQIEEARQRAAAVKARLEAEKAAKAGLANGSNGASPAAPSNGASAPNGSAAPAKSAAEIARERVEALKARVAAATARAKGDEPPPRPAAQTATQQPAYSQRGIHDNSEDVTRMQNNLARGGLAVGIHPALLGDAVDRTKKLNQQKQQKGKGRQQKEEKANPYISEAGPGTSGRAKRELHFNHNLHSRPAMQAANDMRRKAALEQMKKRIQASAAKAGLEESTDIQVFAVPMPPDVEFWDEAFQSGIDGNEALTKLVVHPIMIEPPQEKFVTLKPSALKLTKKEQKKMRRIRRAEEHREEQAKIRLGLAPMPEPKIKHSNVMRVYGELAVKDPTAVEAMVNKQVTERRDTHLEANASRQLTKEQRAEKIAQKAKENAAMGLNMCVFKIALGKDKLLGKHRYKMDINAKQMHDLTGVVIVAPSMAICLVEAGEHSTKKYRNLMLNRIKWQAILDGNGEIQHADEDEADQAEDTTCTLLWQGQVRDRKFKKWGSFREVETDAQAKEALTRAKMEKFWTLAKSSAQ